MSEREVFAEISPADFFYRNRDIAGFSNPARALYSGIRELVENSLDACELHRIPPDVYIRMIQEESLPSGVGVYKLRVEDNGSGVPARHIPSAFGQVFYGSKYRLRQTRGTFGLGGTMAILYGQITTHKPARIISSTGSTRVHELELMIDIQKNKPEVLRRKTHSNPEKWHGTIVEFYLEGDYIRALPKILEYLKQTAIVSPYTNLTFVDPRGRLYKFERVTVKMPASPTETRPHPYGVDVETIRRLIYLTECRDMLSFMTTHFHRVGRTTAKKFLEFAGISLKKKPKKLRQTEIVKLVQAMKNFVGFLPPDASCLSTLGEELIRAGIQKELNPEITTVETRKPAAYSGFPFVIETAIAYGGNVPKAGDIIMYRFANRIPLLYDEASDVSWKVIHTLINWKHYRISFDMPLATFIMIYSTKIPYKTVGKEYIADRPEVEREVLNGLREAARQLAVFLSRRENIARDRRRLDVFSKYLPKIAHFSTDLAGKEKEPDIRPLLRSVMKYGAEEKED